MPAKELRFESEARAALKRGAEAVAKAVSVTLGPRGRAVVLDKKFGPPVVTNDGVTIARDLDFKDHFENMGAQSEEHTSELQSLTNLVCRLLLEKKKTQ